MTILQKLKKFIIKMMKKSSSKYTLTKEEIEIVRTPTELIDWVFSTFEKFYTSREDIIYARSKSTNELKVLFEESYALVRFCEQYFTEETPIVLKQIVGDQNYDVEVVNSEKFNYIEITWAINGHIEALRMKRLNESGHVSANGPVAKIGNKNSLLEIAFDGEITDEMTVLPELGLHSLIKKVAKKKAKKNYPEQTLLVIAFDDGLIIDIESFNQDLFSFIEEEIMDIIKPTFTGLAIVGSTKNSFYIQQ